MYFVSPPIVRNNLVLHLDAANSRSYSGTGSTWKDLSGKGNHGTFSGAGVTFNSSSKSMLIDGSGAGVLIGNSPDLNSSTNITLAAWAYSTKNGPYQYILSNSRDCCGTYNGYELKFYNGSVAFSTWNGSSATIGGSTNLNQWYYIVATYDGATMKTYINGAIDRTFAKANAIGTPASTNLYVGRMGYTNLGLQGNIALVKVYNRALDQTEITQNFNASRNRFGL